MKINDWMRNDSSVLIGLEKKDPLSRASLEDENVLASDWLIWESIYKYNH